MLHDAGQALLRETRHYYSLAVWQRGVEVVDVAEAVAAEREREGAVAQAYIQEGQHS